MFTSKDSAYFFFSVAAMGWYRSGTVLILRTVPVLIPTRGNRNRYYNTGLQKLELYDPHTLWSHRTCNILNITQILSNLTHIQKYAGTTMQYWILSDTNAPPISLTVSLTLNCQSSSGSRFAPTKFLHKASYLCTNSVLPLQNHLIKGALPL
jgi:hypothetical protein